LHGEILDVIGDEVEPVVQSHGCNQGIGDGEGFAFFAKSRLSKPASSATGQVSG
jgi:hypothetical protein